MLRIFSPGECNCYAMISFICYVRKMCLALPRFPHWFANDDYTRGRFYICGHFEFSLPRLPVWHNVNYIFYLYGGLRPLSELLKYSWWLRHYLALVALRIISVQQLLCEYTTNIFDIDLYTILIFIFLSWIFMYYNAIICLF